jgi:hypothetical protein
LIQNLLYHFWTFLLVSMNFGSLLYFLGIKSIKKRFKNRRTVLGRNRPVATVPGSAACHTRLARRPAGPRPGGLVQPRRLPVRSRRCTRVGARDGVVARLLRGRWWLAGGKVLPVSLLGPSGGRRATRAKAGLTEVVARRWGGEVARCGSARRRPLRREGRR